MWGRNEVFFYRSMIVMSGATRPDAHAAAVRSEVILHGNCFVFHVLSFKDRIVVGSGGACGSMTFRGCSRALSF